MCALTITATIDILPALWQVTQVLLVIAASFVVITLIASFIRFQLIAHRVKTANPEELNPADAFQLQIIQRLGIVQREPEPISVLLMAPHDRSISAQHGPDIEKEVMDHLETQIRTNMRKKDFFMRYDDRTFGAVTTAARKDAEVMAARLVDRVTRQSCRCSNNLTLRVPLNIGLATYPENTDRAPELVSKATAMLEASLAAGPGTCRTAPVSTEAASAEEQAGADAVAEAQKGIVDELTGVLRQEKLVTAMQKYVARYRKEGQPVSVLYLSIDYISQYVEHYGREAIDAILKGLGEILTTHTREGDLISRYNDTDFILVMDCAAREAVIAAQRVSAVIKRTPFTHGRANLKISVSFGVAGYPDHGSTPRELFERAQTALQQAQATGRNLCMMYRPDMKKTRQEEKRRSIDRF